MARTQATHAGARLTRCGRRAAAAPAAAAAALLVLAGCAGAPPRTTDGPPALPPPGLATQPDPQPRVEPLRAGGPNKPYEVLGQRYVPLTEDLPYAERGLASWYGRKYHGRPTANGEIFDMYALSAAHRTLPLPSYALVRNPSNGREIVVRVNDRGPFDARMVIDLSYAAAVKLGVERGVAPVELRRLTHAEIRSGSWRRADAAVAAAAPTPASDVPRTAAVDSAPAAAPAAVVATAAPEPPPPEAAPAGPTPAAGDYWVQFGAFAAADGAQALRQRLAQEFGWLAPWLGVYDGGATQRVRAGPYASRADADAVAARIRAALGDLQPFVLSAR